MFLCAWLAPRFFLAGNLFKLGCDVAPVTATILLLQTMYAFAACFVFAVQAGAKEGAHKIILDSVTILFIMELDGKVYGAVQASTSEEEVDKMMAEDVERKSAGESLGTRHVNV